MLLELASTSIGDGKSNGVYLLSVYSTSHVNQESIPFKFPKESKTKGSNHIKREEYYNMIPEESIIGIESIIMKDS
jgi:hypothetical protein